MDTQSQTGRPTQPCDTVDGLAEYGDDMDCSISEQLSHSSVDAVGELPLELVESIFMHLDPESIVMALKTCKSWNVFLEHDDIIWKNLCLHYCDYEDVLQDRQTNQTWKSVFANNFGQNGVLKRWMSGKYSKVKSFHELPQSRYCQLMWCFNVETWGMILESELARN